MLLHVCAILLSLLPPATPLACPSRGQRHSIIRRHATVQTLGVTIPDALRMAQKAQEDTLKWLVDEIDLVSTGDEEFTLPGTAVGTARVQCFEASGTVAHCASLSVAAGNYHVYEVTAWCGPKTDVPHFTARMEMDLGDDGDSMVDLFVDWRPRLDAGYDQPKTADGAYAPPSTRGGFLQAGYRKDYSARFFTDDTDAWRDGVLATPGAVESALQDDRVEVQHHATCSGLIRGPMALSLRLPFSGGMDVACAVCLEAAERWTGWILDGRNVVLTPGNAVGWQVSRMTYARDCEVRKQLNSQLETDFAARFGAIGFDMARAVNGRMDQVGHNTLGLGRDD